MITKTRIEDAPLLNDYVLKEIDSLKYLKDFKSNIKEAFINMILVLIECSNQKKIFIQLI